MTWTIGILIHHDIDIGYSTQMICAYVTNGVYCYNCGEGLSWVHFVLADI